MTLLRLPQWIWIWTVVATILVSIDCAYVLGLKFNLLEYVPEVITNAWGWYGESDAQYARSGQGMRTSNGWIETQSMFNCVEVFGQLLFLFVVPKQTISSALLILVVSVATFWKTLLYLVIIMNSSDPVEMVPLLACVGYEPKEENKRHVEELLAKEDCATQFFKFQFNFWWVILPACTIFATWRVISKACSKIKIE